MFVPFTPLIEGIYFATQKLTPVNKRLVDLSKKMMGTYFETIKPEFPNSDEWKARKPSSEPEIEQRDYTWAKCYEVIHIAEEILDDLIRLFPANEEIKQMKVNVRYWYDGAKSVDSLWARFEKKFGYS